MIHLSARSEIDPFFAMDVLASANRRKELGQPVISMAVGQPAALCPSHVVAAASEALKLGRIGYTDALGLPVLREKIAAYYKEHHGLSISAERIAVTTGSSAAFALAFLSYFDAGDRVAVTRPGYPAYRNIMKALGIEVVEIDTAGTGLLTAAALEAAHKIAPLKGVLFASPSNPTGAVVPAGEVKAIVETASRLSLHVISDEIYHRLNYTCDDVTALTYSDEVTVINSFSKYYCMTGWRVGWMVLPKQAVRAVERIAQSMYISAPELSQLAAISAFDAIDELELVKQTYRTNRDMLASSLPEIGFKLLAPMDGAFYAYCDVSQFTNDSMIFAKKMLEEINVAATPGLDFDPIEGHRSLRLSYAGETTSIKEALMRLKQWLS